MSGPVFPGRGQKLSGARDMRLPINILHLRDTYEIGGPGKTILETAAYIDKGFRMQIAVFKTRKEPYDSPFTNEARRRGLPVHFIEGFNQYDPLMIRRLVGLVRKLDIDILHAHETKSDIIGYLASRFSDVRLVTTSHGWISNSLKQRVMTRLDKLALRSYDRVIAVSDEIRKELSASGCKNLTLLHNGIVVENYRNTGKRGYLRKLAGIEKNAPVIGSIGRLSAEKGHKDLVLAVSEVVKAGHDVSCFLVGDGPERGGIESLINELSLGSHVFLTGYIRTPQPALEDFDLMVLPSYTEGLPNAVLESLLMDVPVIATAVGGTPEIIESGVNGVTVNPARPDEIAGRIIEFLNNRGLYREMAKRGKKDVIERFNFAGRTRSLEKIYSEVMLRN